MRMVSTKVILDKQRFISLAALFVLPFQGSPIVNCNLLDIQGLKPFTILAVAALAGELSRQKPWRFQDVTERGALLWYLAYVCVFLVVFARSIPHLPIFHALFPSQFRDSRVSYFLSFFLRPALSTCLFPLIIRQFQTEDEVHLVRRTISISMAVLSASVLAIILSTPDIYLGGRRHMAVTFQHHLGLHYNSLGTIYIVTGPLLFCSALEDRMFPKLNAMAAAIVIATIQSRSALVIFWVESLVLLLVLRKGFAVVAINLVATGLFHLWSAPSVTAIRAVGWSHDTLNPDDILSGRLRFLWLPLLSEWIANPARLLWGAGRYGILVSAHFTTGSILRVTHAHNAFVDLFLDTGVIGVIVAVVVLAAGLSRAWRTGRSIRDPLFWTLAVCLCGYLAGTLTERGFFPSYDNLLLFPVLALLVNVARRRTRAIGEPASHFPAGAQSRRSTAP
ncbi:MAG: hypothetical protein H6Q33_570 [Deltaproteobacteria bacterium]|nr:hypothetical protein [Deltaproteobacteria bacterium]